MERNKVQWRIIAKGEKLPCDSFLMRKDGTIPSVVSSAGVIVGQDAYYLPVEELRSFPKEEIEDEKIIQYFKDLAPFDKADELYDKYGFSHKDAIAWLEKQSEQKPIISNNALREGITHFGITQYQIDNWLKKYVDVEKQGEQESEDKVEPHPTEDRYMEGYLNGINDASKTLKSAAWSEEDERLCQCLIEDQKEALDKVRNNMYGHSEIISDLKEMYHERIDWLKSLKGRLKPQNRWKPSDEQMSLLQAIINEPNNAASESCQIVLKDTLKQLKKLKEESV